MKRLVEYIVGVEQSCLDPFIFPRCPVIITAPLPRPPVPRDRSLFARSCMLFSLLGALPYLLSKVWIHVVHLRTHLPAGAYSDTDDTVGRGRDEAKEARWVRVRVDLKVLRLGGDQGRGWGGRRAPFSIFSHPLKTEGFLCLGMN